MLDEWWLHSRKRISKTMRKGFDTMALLVTWMLWRERNDRVFNGKSILAFQLASRIVDEVAQWIMTADLL
jgi:hypothetical protein